MGTPLSLAIIVKNAEPTFEKCLSSARPVVDELIVVDTGSTDKTIEIAKKYADRIEHFTWIDDFSAARNYSFSLCTKEWITWLDSDDYVPPEEADKIKALDFTDKDIIIANYVYAKDQHGNSRMNVPRERFIRRSLGLRWEGEIHEYFRMGNARVWVSDINIHHEKQHGTSERNIALLEKSVKKNPDNPRNVYYLGKEYYEAGRNDEALPHLERFVLMPGAFWEDVYMAHYKLAEMYFDKDDQKFLKNIYESIKSEERRAEPFYLLGLFWQVKKAWDKAIQWYSMCLLAKRPKGLLATYRPEYYTWMPRMQLAYCYNAINDIEKAYEHNKEFLRLNPHDSRAVNNDKVLGEALKKKESLQDGKGKKLHIGCGNRRIEGYTNVDIFQGPAVDEVFPMDRIPYQDNTISGILSEHALEHVPFDQSEQTLKEWFRVLKPSGELILFIPDFEICCQKYLAAPLNDAVFQNTRAWYKATIYGIQKSQAGEPDDAQIHKCGYSKEEIRIVLERYGFKVISVENYGGPGQKPDYGTPSMEIRAMKLGNCDTVLISKDPSVVAYYADHGIEVCEMTGREALAVDAKVYIIENPGEQDMPVIQQMLKRGLSVYGHITKIPYKPAVGLLDVVACTGDLYDALKEINPRTTLLNEGLSVTWLVKCTDLNDPATRIRRYNVFDAMEKHGIHSRVISGLYHGILEHLSKDTAVIFTGYGKEELELMQALKGRGVKLFYDICEAVFDGPYQAECMAQADMVVCCSTKLAELAAIRGLPVTVIKDAIEGYAPHDYDYKYVRPRAVYAGMGGNSWLVMDYLKQSIEKAGYDLVVISEWDNATIKWNRDTWLSGMASCDVVLCPQRVDVQPAKSNVKVTQAMALGMPVIASPIQAYKEVIDHGRNGYLADSTDEWYRALIELKDPDKRRMIGTAARESVGGYSMDAIVGQWKNLVMGRKQEVKISLEGVAPVKTGTPVDIIVLHRSGPVDGLKETLNSVLMNTAWVYSLRIADCTGRDDVWNYLDPLQGFTVYGCRGREQDRAVEAIKGVSARFFAIIESGVKVPVKWLDKWVEVMETGGRVACCGPDPYTAIYAKSVFSEIGYDSFGSPVMFDTMAKWNYITRKDGLS